MRVISQVTKWYFSKSALPYWCILLLDSIIVLVSGYFACYWEFGGNIFLNAFWPVTRGLFITVLLFLVAFRIFHTYSGIIRYSSFIDLQRVAIATSTGAAATYVLFKVQNHFHFMLQEVIMPNFIEAVLILIFSAFMMATVRVLVKTLFDLSRIDAFTTPIFIYGVKEGGVGMAKNIRNAQNVNYKIVGFVSHSTAISDYRLMGVKVYKDDDKLLGEMRKLGVKKILISPLQSEHFREREDLINGLIANGIQIYMMPLASVWDGKSELQHTMFREVEIEDLLPREKIEVDMDAIGALLKDKCILITGAAGSIGSEMVRQVVKFGPSQMVLIDQAETPMHDVRLFMHNQYPDVKAETIVTSITNKGHMERIFSEFRPEYVFHAAAYKHVPMMEDNPGIAIQNNVFGTRVMADLSVKYGVKKFVMISTDKAVNPTNVMGCSKRICEIYCQSLNKAIQDGTCPIALVENIDGSKPEKPVTQFVTTRFGNVLGSNGSVIPIFKEQIKKGGPITVTHPDIIRFFMLIPEACRLVLEAGTMGKGGEIFVFDMGKPVRIVDLAKRMISLSGAQNVEIKFTGLRDGEKLYEEVLSDKENTQPTVHPKIMVASVREYEYQAALANEERLLQASYGFDDMAIVKIMKEIVPEYKSKSSKYEILDRA